MTTRQLKRFVTEFREGVLAGRGPYMMCFAVCAPLQGFLSVCCGIKTELREAWFNECNHCWLELPDGRIIDPTADQFGMEPVYIGKLPLSYATRKARIISWPDAVDPQAPH